jgi:tRNA(Ile)-lysidine synthase
MLFFPEKLLAYLPRQADRWWLGISGGLDSMVLLESVVQLSRKYDFPPVWLLHVNHGLSIQSGRWQQRVIATAIRLGLPYRIIEVNIAQSDVDANGPEAAARTARYDAFARYLQPGQILLLAHHGDDQAETVLLRMFRGAGVAGLCGMPAQRKLANGQLYRPLLGFTRKQLHHWAVKEQLVWIEDPSNLESRFDRNFLRLQVMPLLRSRWPKLQQRLSATASLMRQQQDLIDEIAVSDYQSCQDGSTAILWVSNLLSLSLARRYNVLRFWLNQQNQLAPTQQQLITIDKQVLQASPAAQPQYRLGSLVLRRSVGKLYLLPDAQPQWLDVKPFQVSMARLQDCNIALGNYCLQRAMGGCRLRPKDWIQLSLRQGGERCQPHGRHHSQSLKKLLQEAGVPVWQRDCIPLLWVNDQLAMVGNLWTCKGFQAAAQEPSWRLQAINKLT